MIYLGPSAAKRWLRCTASPGFINRNADKLPRDQSDYADEGIEAHNHAAKALEVYGLYDYDVIKDETMRGHVQGYVEFVLAKLEPGDELLVERRFPLFYMPKRNGIVDAGILRPGRIIVNDYKNGFITVDAVENEQMAIYARNFVEHLLKRGDKISEDTVVEMNIYQPKEEQPVKNWTVTLAELYQFCERIARTASEILLNPDGGVFYPEEDTVCRFCDAKPICTTRAAALLGELPGDVVPEAKVSIVPRETKVGFPAVESLTLEQVSKLLTVRQDLKKWLDEVSEYGRALALEQGIKVPGFKVVEGKSNRQWRDEKEAEHVLGYRLTKDEIYPRSMISPAQAETLLKKKNLTTRLENMLSKVIIKPQGGQTLVPDSDPRPDVVTLAIQEFDNLENENTQDLL